MTESRWRDLGPRIASAVVLITLAVWCFWAGSFAFGVLISVFTGLMIWELTRMIGAKTVQLPVILGLVAGGVTALSLFGFDHVMLFGVLFLIAALFLSVEKDRWISALYGMSVLFTGAGLVVLMDAEPELVVSIIVVVVATDVAGYFAGKSIGGRKFWPSISPKKTWSGIAAGWIVAGLLGFLLGGDLGDMLIAVLMSFASQMGDIAESAIKRRAGVKDSSNLIPGHGGVLDRFDGIVGATLVLAGMVSLFGI